MLTKCPECELQVSDKASVCPHCGYPLKLNISIPKQKKRMRLPNGFGQITRINNKNLRKPWRAMVTTGVTEHGRPICKILKPQGYFATYNDAYAALVEYNKDPYELDKSITVGELYEKWSEEHFKTLKSPSSIRTITSAWAYCDKIKNIRVKDVKARHIKDVIETGSVKDGASATRATPNIKGRIKSIFNMMFDYAVEYEMTDRNYARTFELSGNIIEERENARRGHMPFMNDEMDILWENVDKVEYVDALLIQCYMGWRPQELGLIKIEDVNMDELWIRGGIKTDAGRNREVPIHSKILPLVKKRYKEALESGSEWLIPCNGQMTYDKYGQRFKKILARLDLNPQHRAHDGRSHFITLCKKYKVDEYAIKYMVGHSIGDLTERVYTKREQKWLLEEIEKIEKEL